MKIMFLLLFSSSFLNAGTIKEGQIIEFESDYCTAYPEGTRRRPNLWKHCCLEHDLYFWAGGSKEDRNFSDLILKSCVEATGERLRAKLMHMAVSLGGLSPIKFSTKKWGNGWVNRTPFRNLSSEEKDILISHIKKNPLVTESLLMNFIHQLRSRKE